MAYTPKEDEDQQSGMNVLAQNEQSQAIQEEEKNLSPSSSATPLAPTSQEAPTAQKAPTSGQSNAQSAGGAGSGTFTNLAKYRQANKPAAQGIADAVSKGAENKAGEIGQAVQQQKSQFQSQVDANRARMEAASNFAQGQIQGAGADTSQENTQKFQNLLNKPNQFNQASANFVPVEQQVSQMANTAQDANRQNARMQLLRDTFGGQDKYTQGQQNLDDLIVSGDLGARTQMANAPQQAVQGIQDQIAQAKQYALAQKALLGQEEAQMREGIQTGVDDAQQSMIDRLQGAIETAPTEIGSMTNIINAFETGEFTPEILEELGLKDNRTYNVDPMEFLKGNATIGNVATQEDLARAQALAGLEGSQQDIFLDPNEIGTYKDTETASLDQLRDAIALKKSEMDKATTYEDDFYNKFRQAFGIGTGFEHSNASQHFYNSPQARDMYNKSLEQGVVDLASKGYFDTLEGSQQPLKDQYLRDYSYDNVIMPKVFNDGGVKESPRLASIKKLLGY